MTESVSVESFIQLFFALIAAWAAWQQTRNKEALSKAEERMAESEGRKADSTALLTVAETANQALGQNTLLTSQYLDLSKTVGGLEVKVNNLETANEELTKELDAALKRIAELEGERDTLKSELDENEKQRKELTGAVKEKNTEITKLQKRVKELEAATEAGEGAIPAPEAAGDEMTVIAKPTGKED